MTEQELRMPISDAVEASFQAVQSPNHDARHDLRMAVMIAAGVVAVGGGVLRHEDKIAKDIETKTRQAMDQYAEA